jgi:hypothetical protein
VDEESEEEESEDEESEDEGSEDEEVTLIGGAVEVQVPGGGTALGDKLIRVKDPAEASGWAYYRAQAIDDASERKRKGGEAPGSPRPRQRARNDSAPVRRVAIDVGSESPDEGAGDIYGETYRTANPARKREFDALAFMHAKLVSDGGGWMEDGSA